MKGKMDNLLCITNFFIVSSFQISTEIACLLHCTWRHSNQKQIKNYKVNIKPPNNQKAQRSLRVIRFAIRSRFSNEMRRGYQFNRLLYPWPWQLPCLRWTWTSSITIFNCNRLGTSECICLVSTNASSFSTNGNRDATDGLMKRSDAARYTCHYIYIIYLRWMRQWARHGLTGKRKLQLNV